MRVAFVIERLCPERGGAETYVSEFTRALASEGGGGHDVHVYARGGSTAPEGVTLHEVGARGPGAALRAIAFARNVERTLTGERFDIIQGVGKTWTHDLYQPHGGVHRATLEANLLTRTGAAALAKLVATEFSPRQIAYRYIEQVQYRRRPAKLFVALSQMVRRDMQRFYRLSDERIAVVYNGVDTERYHPRNRDAHRAAVRARHGIGEDETVFLIVAHNFRLKGVPELVDCVTGELGDCRLLVVGGGSASALAARAERRAPGRVIFTGPVADAAPYYAAADAYVHPTNYDPCSLVVLEALASGLPVVTSTMNGAGELMTHGREGFIVSPARQALTRPKAWHREMAGVLSKLTDASLQNKMSAAARALAERHTIAHNVREMTALYEKISGKAL